MLGTLAMIGPSAKPPSNYDGDHPLRAALAFGDRLLARNVDALEGLLLAHDRSLLSEAVVFQVQGLITSLADELIGDGPPADEALHSALVARLSHESSIRSHLHAMAIEWRLTLRLEADMGLDPVLAPAYQHWVGHGDPVVSALAMAALTAQSRFAQAQRRMRASLSELPAELFHTALVSARDCASDAALESVRAREAGLRSSYDEGSGRLALQARLAQALGTQEEGLLELARSGVGLWLTALSHLTGEDRDRLALATVEPLLGRLLLTLRAAGQSPQAAESQALLIEPDADLPKGLHEVGTREAAQWLLQKRRGEP